MRHVPFVIQPGTKGIFNEQNPSSIVWKCRFNFFYAVHHEMLLLVPQVSAYILFYLLKRPTEIWWELFLSLFYL